MSLHVRQETLHLALRDPFRIARADEASSGSATTVVIELRDDRLPGLVGVGEGFPDHYYGETAETIAAVLPMLLHAVGEPEPSVAGLIGFQDPPRADGARWRPAR